MTFKLHTILLILLAAACLCFAHGCASDPVTKTNAVTSVGVSTGVGVGTFAGGLLTAGWAWVVGAAAGLISLFFGKAPPPQGAQPAFDIPWIPIILGLFVLFKGEHLFNLVFRGGGIDSLLRFFAVKRTIKPKKSQPRP